MLNGLPLPLPTFMSRKPEVSVAERSCAHRVPFPVRGNVPSDGCEIEIKHKFRRHLPFRSLVQLVFLCSSTSRAALKVQNSVPFMYIEMNV